MLDAVQEHHGTGYELRSRCSVQRNLRQFRPIGGQARSSHNLAISVTGDNEGDRPGTQILEDVLAPEVSGRCPIT